MIVKGFINVHSLLSNVPGHTSVIGELSALGYTYSFEKGFYQNKDYPNYDLITFLCADEQGAEQVLPAASVTFTMRVMQALMAYYGSRLPPYSHDNLRVYLYTELPNQIAQLEVGDVMTQNGKSLPQWISYVEAATGNQFYIWLCDEAFRQQYDGYNIIVVPPLPHIDALLYPFNTVANLIVEEPVDLLMRRAEDAKQSRPETYTRVYRFDRIDPTNPTRRIETLWPILIYGDAGDNIDSIKDAIIDYILQHTSHTRSQWEAIYPEIFKRTEFIVLPRWDKIAAPNMLTQTGLYSSLIEPNEAISFALQHIDFYTTIHTRQNICLVPCAYKSLMLEIINGQFNIDGRKVFSDLYADYMPIPSVSLDFNRMTIKTQELVYKLEEMLLVAEKMTRYSFIPKTMKRIRRSNKIYLSRIIDNINFVIVPKTTLGGL